eukprot:3105938-Rhodomonas_salina.2
MARKKVRSDKNLKKGYPGTEYTCTFTVETVYPGYPGNASSPLHLPGIVASRIRIEYARVFVWRIRICASRELLTLHERTPVGFLVSILLRTDGRTQTRY